ncbi:acyl-CoA thioesterase-1 [Natronocella acetinitrilica]|jgi:acyl-CoA thioesterase I|uniref:Acyl-CoA thioesterase-1 n=1 Tax=Natronocella acetinitrilica TaxID=414046 RepID=A0AAE3KA38_9GAMM|nr:arylesterase [Natronocella acetinitrilica]MCP1673054.1 acyl-CoA thioesterase-1 [Natronocella acetinitrilica]
MTTLKSAGLRLPLLLLLLVPVMAVVHADTRTVLVVGDSLSAAYNMDRDQGWVHLLHQRLESEQPGWNVANASITGDTTRGGLSRLPGALDEHRPSIVIIALGGNDGLRALPPVEIRNNLERMIELSREAGAEVMLAGVRIPANYGPAYSRRFEQVFHDVADAVDVPLLPSILAEVEERADLFQGDGIHPSEAAQPVILDNVWTVLRPMIRG